MTNHTSPEFEVTENKDGTLTTKVDWDPNTRGVIVR